MLVGPVGIGRVVDNNGIFIRSIMFVEDCHLGVEVRVESCCCYCLGRVNIVDTRTVLQHKTLARLDCHIRETVMFVVECTGVADNRHGIIIQVDRIVADIGELDGKSGRSVHP